MKKTESIQNSQVIFSMAVEKKAQEEGTTLLEALTDIVKENHVEPEDIVKKKLISRSLKEKLEAECVQKGLIKGEKVIDLFGE